MDDLITIDISQRINFTMICKYFTYEQTNALHLFAKRAVQQIKCDFPFEDSFVTTFFDVCVTDIPHLIRLANL